MLIFLGVWFIASLLNGLLSGISIAFIDSSSFNEAMQNLAFSIFFSFVFSVPLVGFVWLVTAIAQLAGKKGDPLFQLILSTALFCALAAAVVFINTIGTEFKQVRYIVGLCIIISALGAILIFRMQLKRVE